MAQAPLPLHGSDLWMRRITVSMFSQLDWAGARDTFVSVYARQRHGAPTYCTNKDIYWERTRWGKGGCPDTTKNISDGIEVARSSLQSPDQSLDGFPQQITLGITLTIIKPVVADIFRWPSI